MVQSNGSDDKRGILYVLSKECKEICILDSRCSYHMKSHGEWFTRFKLNIFEFVYLGDDKTCIITG